MSKADDQLPHVIARKSVHGYHGLPTNGYQQLSQNQIFF